MALLSALKIVNKPVLSVLDRNLRVIGCIDAGTSRYKAPIS